MISPRRSLVLVLLLLLPTASVFAQAEPLTYDTFTSNTIDETNPARFYEFTAEAGDYIAIEAIALNSTLDPQISLLAGQSALASSSDDPFQPGSRDARLTYLIDEAGTYTILVQSQNRTTGQFVLRLDLLEQETGEALAAGIVTTASVTPDLPTRVFTFDSAVGTTVSVSSAAPGVAFVVEVHAPDGQTIAVQRGPLVTTATTIVAPNSGIYRVIIGVAQANQSATLEILFGEAATGTAPQPEVAEGETTTEDETAELPVTAPADAENPAITGLTPVPEGETVVEGEDEEEAPAQQVSGSNAAAANAPANRCTVVPVGNVGVNVRAEPTTDAAVIASIPGGEFRFAEATDGAWIELLGGGWVSSGVVEQSDPCAALPRVTTIPTIAPVDPAAPTATVDPQNVNPIGQRGN